MVMHLANAQAFHRFKSFPGSSASPLKRFRPLSSLIHAGPRQGSATNDDSGGAPPGALSAVLLLCQRALRPKGPLWMNNPCKNPGIHIYIYIYLYIIRYKWAGRYMRLCCITSFHFCWMISEFSEWQMEVFREVVTSCIANSVVGTWEIDRIGWW